MRRGRGGGRHLRSVAAAALLPPPAPGQVAARRSGGVARAADGTVQGRGPWGAGWPRGAPRLSAPWRGSRGSRAPRTEPPSRAGFGAVLDRSGGGGAESQWKGWSQALSFSLRGLPGLRLGEFSRRGERGSAGERFLFGGDTKVRHFFQAKVSPLLQPDPGTVRPCWKPARTTTCYSSGSGKTTLNSSCF